ncbi:MAG: hypothetical protein M3R15_23675 [Acidobacteriota bacterium]|nr:hypothetical protein [Acidobacteriota bacterium]
MPKLFVRRTVLMLFALFIALSFNLPDTSAQARRRKRPSRRITNPVRPQQATSTVPVPAVPSSGAPTSTDPTVVSTADESGIGTDNPTSQTTSVRGRRRTPEPENLRRTVDSLSAQVTSLSESLIQMREQQRALVNLERLTRAEQRAESLRTQLRDVTDKEFALQERTAQVEDDIQPEAIERRAALTGSLRPADLRDQIRRTFERERERLRAQLQLLATSRARLETAVANADTEVERIRALIDADERTQTDRNTNQTATGEVNPAAPPPATSTTIPPPNREPSGEQPDNIP